jgi:predicted LPLAT superfamily acyltransferase
VENGETGMDVERELLLDQFAAFERGVLQDNIILSDQKSGILLAFSGAMVIFCIEAISSPHAANHALNYPVATIDALYLLAALGFLVSCHFSLTTVFPRIRHGRDDHIFWESSLYRLPADEFVARLRAIDVAAARDDKSRHIHTLAGICRDKFAHFRRSIQFAQGAFLLLVVAELARVVIA